MKLTYKIHTTLLIAALIGAVFLYFNRSITTLMDVHTRLLNHLSQLQTLETNIDMLVAQTSTQFDFRLNDLQQIDVAQKNILAELQRNPNFQANAFMVQLLSQYLNLQQKKITLVETLHNHHQPLIADLIWLQARQFDVADLPARDTLQRLHAALTWMFMSQQMLPLSYQLDNVSDTRLRQEIRQHIDSFQTNLPIYLDIRQHLRQLRLAHLGETMKAHLFQVTRRETLLLEWISWMLSSVFAIAIAIIIFMLLRTERENKKLLALRAELEIAMCTDRLTGLGNRLRFEADRKHFQHPAVLLLNIDGFKHVNAFYGIPAGDYVLQSLATLIIRTIPTVWQQHVYRTGADDFVVLFELQRDSISPEHIAHQLLYEIDAYPFRHEDYSINLSVSIALSDVDPLLETADMAYKYIESRRIKYLEYSDELGIYQQIEANLDMWRSLKNALDNDTLVPYFQPIINNHTRQIEKYECLARLIDETGQVLTPGDFLTVAKHSGLYAEITMRMIAKSFAVFLDQPYDFSINIAPEDIVDGQVRHFIRKHLKNHPKAACRVTFEILESEHISDYTDIRDFITEVQRYGCKIAIDDFGAGYSNLSHVLNLNVDYLKIDGTLIKDLDTNPQSQILVQTIVDFSRKIHIKALIAEYVGSAEVLELLSQMGVDYSQGFYLGKPAPTLAGKSR